MKNFTITLILCFFSSFYIGQVKRFMYEYDFAPDFHNIKNREIHIMFLDITKEGSFFFDGRKYVSDSTISALVRNNQFGMPPREAKFIDYRVTKKYPSYTLTYIINSYNNRLHVLDPRVQNWKIEKVIDKYKGYTIQKATTEFAGRKWIAWFSSDIPIPDGPYKFYGLPGLILKIEDITGSHKFSLVGIKNNIPAYNYPVIDAWRKKLNLSLEKYIEIYKEYRRDPAKEYRIDVAAGRIYESTDLNGAKVSPLESLRQYESVQKSIIARDNNIIEIDLLKK
ncbi:MULTISPECIES: GLPGLI family protein [Elizabethkingia]|uniref:GLPGLI family protein n=1 Tax=Elizabethkingia TaxID=308865 RepID=UPI0009842F04|nr:MULTISPECIES: GLPGLI family protein [Elizabethkingia]MBG0513762.1 GLPGLI family protein [Elizabethkingia meningoseptica]MDE5436207.1 GLPGLI family protein [Elizabethkingia meningoseptica]MDE5538743.1 GLPGLI family protein [Elizabethkingia meningoseptica]MDX8576862.1 GLPGLI family protein [Elizabethkingia sp. HX WYD]HAY3556703.1 GLPGLI family protein [Elizabethkingia meningoseptica]